MYSELVKKYVWMKDVFNTNFSKFSDKFEEIQYVDPDVNYDGFCDNNKINEKRRANSQFIVNLALNGFISNLSVARILRQLLDTIMNTITRSDKKNEVDEMTENVAILFNKQMIEDVIEEADDEEEYNVGDATILETIESLANKKAKDCASLSNKAIFKYMDLVEM